MRRLWPKHGTGRAAEGRRLAAQGLMLNIVMSFAAVFLGLVLVLASGDAVPASLELSLSSLTANVVIALFFLWGISREIVWTGIGFAIYSVALLPFGFTATQPQFNLLAIVFPLGYGIAAFVVLSGLVIWFRNRTRVEA